MDKSQHFNFQVVKAHVRELRSCMTDSEKLLWRELRNRKLSGYKFVRQHPIIYKSNYKGLNYFVADFYCALKKTAIELDGPIHETTSEYDEFRDSEMKFLGINVLRLKNDDLLNLKESLQKIENYLNFLPDKKNEIPLFTKSTLYTHLFEP
jgi:leucyl-tRNA synthetase